MSAPLDQRVLARLRSLGEHQLLRRLQPPAGIDFSSNDYLGLADDARIKSAMIAAVAALGCGSTGSRLLRGHRDAFTAIEERFARFKGTERSLYFSSGYLANLAVLGTFPEACDLILSDERNHASIIDGVRLSAAPHVVFPHDDLTTLTRLVEERRHADGVTFVVTESIFSMDGDVPRLSEYAALCRDCGALLIVDEAHAVGMYGPRGSGLIEALGIDGDVFLSINTAGKALGVSGAFVAGPAWAIELLVQRARPFIFSTAPPPAVAAAIDASLDIVDAEPERRRQLAARSAMLRVALGDAGIGVPSGFSQIIPVVLGENERAVAVASALAASGFDVRAIRPPSVAPGAARLRISVNVNLSEATLHRFAAALAAAGIAAPCSAASS